MHRLVKLMCSYPCSDVERNMHILTKLGPKCAELLCILFNILQLVCHSLR